tara:strand:- start:607 stop:903 length:297 start_codon:yes stop_codon:yes gene_type:complete
MNGFTEKQNELYNENCQKFIEKYGILKKQDNSIIEGLSNLIYAQTYNELPESMKQNMPCPNLDYVDLMAQGIYQAAFPNIVFEEIEQQIKIELNKRKK